MQTENKKKREWEKKKKEDVEKTSKELWDTIKCPDMGKIRIPKKEENGSK